MKIHLFYVALGFVLGLAISHCIGKVDAKDRPDPCEQLMNQCVHGGK